MTKKSIYISPLLIAAKSMHQYSEDRRLDELAEFNLNIIDRYFSKYTQEFLMTDDPNCFRIKGENVLFIIRETKEGHLPSITFYLTKKATNPLSFWRWLDAQWLTYYTTLYTCYESNSLTLLGLALKELEKI